MLWLDNNVAKLTMLYQQNNLASCTTLNSQSITVNSSEEIFILENIPKTAVHNR